jgi:ribosomal protein S18 acetylase RimI-like enzyme
VAKLRPATVADAREIAEVHVEGWRWAYRGLLPEAFLDGLSVDERTEMWRMGLRGRDPRWGCFVAAAEDGRIVGFVGFGPPEDASTALGEDAGEVYAIYLLHEAQGTGVGRALFQEARGALRAAGYRWAFLWVLASNELARRFYEAAGWRWDGTTSDHRFDCGNLPIVRYVVDLHGTFRSSSGT